MTIDERLEALTERHEALAQSMEITHHDIQGLLKTSREQSLQIKEHSQQLKQDAENIRAMVRIAELHHERIERLDEQQ